MRWAALLLMPVLATASHVPDGDYDQEVWFEWNTSVIDIWIVPPAHGQIYNGQGILNGLDTDELHPYANSYLAEAERAVQAWQDGVATWGGYLDDGAFPDLVLRPAVVGRDTTNAGNLPEIVVATDETMGNILGLAYSSRPCLVLVSMSYVQSFTEEDMFNVMVHEIGHCLGLEHVTGDHPSHDVLNSIYQQTPGSFHNVRVCPSNLNIETVQGAFAGAFGRPPAERGAPGVVSTGDYAQLASC